MEFYYYSPSETFVVLTANQFVGRDDGLLEQQRQDIHVCRKNFATSYYKQINGVAMGTKMGPSYTNLFVGYIE